MTATHALWLGIVTSCVACHPTTTSSPVAPTSPATPMSPPVDNPDEPQSPVAEPEPQDFTVTVASRCPDAWQVSLIARDKEQPRSTVGRFEASAQARALALRPGDALVLTNANGGIMAVDFDDVAPGHTANVEIAADCSGLSKTVRRAVVGE